VFLRGLRLWLRLPWLQRRVLVRAAVWLGLTDIGLRMLGFRRMIDLVPAASADGSPPDTSHIGIYVAAIEIVANHHVVPAHCLHKSVVLQFWLRREGIPSKLRIGVRKEGQQLKAHAWVEVDGQVVNDDPRAIAAFQPLAAPHLTNVTWTDSIAPTSIHLGDLSKVEA
jgi:hypothetical protein